MRILVSDNLAESGLDRLMSVPDFEVEVKIDSPMPSTQGAGILVQADLAATLSAIAAQGPRGFYEGPIAEAMVAAATRGGRSARAAGGQ